MKHSNPFADFGSIVTQSRFIGRDQELRAILSRVFSVGAFGSMAVVGLPRIGKTSLVAEAIRKAESQCLTLRTVVVRANVGEFDSIGGLFRSLITDLSETVRERSWNNEEIDRRVNAALEQGSFIGFDAVRRVFRSFTRGMIRSVCVLDEFDAGRRLFKDSPQCFHWLRELCSNSEFKAAVIFIAKRRLQDVSRLAGHDSGYWANVLMILSLRSFQAGEIGTYFGALDHEGIILGSAERDQVCELCGGNPYLLDCFAYHAWERLSSGKKIDSEWITDCCWRFAREYVEQVMTILGTGAALSKAFQVLIGPQLDISREDLDDLEELGVVHNEGGILRGFSRVFEDRLKLVERKGGIWNVWGQAERVLREVLEFHLKEKFGYDWPRKLSRTRPEMGDLVKGCLDRSERERHRFQESGNLSLLSYAYPKDLYSIMRLDWAKLGMPLLGADRQGWLVKFDVLSKVRTPLAHNREEVVSEGERLQAKGICDEILEKYEKWSK